MNHVDDCPLPNLDAQIQLNSQSSPRPTSFPLLIHLFSTEAFTARASAPMQNEGIAQITIAVSEI